MKHLPVIFGLILFFVCYHVVGQTKETSNKYKVVVMCDKSAPEMHMVIAGNICYIDKKQALEEALNYAKINAYDVKIVNIFKKGGTPQWIKYSSLAPEYKDRLISIYEVIRK